MTAARKLPPPPPQAKAKRAPAKKPTPLHKAPNLHEVAHDPLDDAIDKLSTEHVQCRDFGHSWRPRGAVWIPRDNCFKQTFACARCTTERYRYLNSRGSILSASYDYPEGYQMTGHGFMTSSDRDRVRLASMKSFLVEDTVQE